MKRPFAATNDLRVLWCELPPSLRNRVWLLLTLVVASGVAEIASIGLILPFLSLLNTQAGDYPPFLQALTARARVASHMDLIVISAAILVAVVILSNFLRLFTLHRLYRWSFGAGQILSVSIFKRVLARSYPKQIGLNSAQTIADLNKANAVSNGFLLPFVQGLAALIISCFIVAVMLWVNTSVALFSALALVAIYISLTMYTRRPMAEASSTVALAWRQRTQLAQESIGGVRDLILDGTAPHFMLLYDESERQLRDAQRLTNFLAAAPRFLVEAFGFVTLISIALWLLSRGEALSSIVPTLGAMAVGAQRLLPLLQQSYAAIAGLNSNRQAIQDVADLLREQPSLPVGPSIHQLSFSERILFDHVSFAYSPSKPDVLRELSLEIRRGDHIGIFGPSGGGKSTFMDILLGLQAPTSGRILVDETPLDCRTLTSWHQKVAHVPQNVFLADCSIAENIAFGVPRDQIDMVRLERAAEGAQVTRFSEGLPLGLWTIVGERGTTLSGGQKQRIGIARALYKRAQLLVLDEITSALDSETEQEIVRTIRNLPTDRTIVVIAHRLTTLAQCNRLFELKDSRLHERGAEQLKFSVVRCE